MYRESGGTRCPACGSGLYLLQAAVPIAGCESCGGIWLGPDATIHILQGLGDAVEEEVAAVSLDLARRSIPPAAPPAESSSRACPTCTVVMSRLPIGMIVVDSCPAHGTFFDRNEVVDVVSACHRLRAQQDSRAMERRFDPEKKSAAEEMVALLGRVLHDWLFP